MAHTIISLNEPSYELMSRFAEAYLREFEGAELNVIEVGSQARAGEPPYRQIFAHAQWRYRSLDIVAGENVDIVVDDPCNWRALQDASVDVVIAGHALERFEFPRETMRDIARILRPGGLTCLIVPSAGPQQAHPGNCWRVHADGLKALARHASLHVVEAFTASGLGTWQETFGVLQKPPWSDLAIRPAFPEALDKGVGRRFFLEWFAKRPQSADYYLDLARLMLEEGRLSKAIAALRYGLDLIPAHAELQQQLQQMEDLAAANSPLLAGAIAALGVRPVALEPVRGAGDFFDRARSFERHQLVQSQLGDLSALRQIANLAELDQRYGLAAQCWETVVAAQRTGLGDLLAWARNTLGAGSRDAARKLYRQARALQLENGVVNRTTIVQRLIWKLQARTYLEIGVERGTNLLQIEAPRRIAVGPNLRIPGGARDIDGICFIASTSDEFFAAPPSELTEHGVDVVLLDELHAAGQALRDIENSLRFLTPGGIVLLHNCNPASEAEASPNPEQARELPGVPQAWTGDVFRTIVCLRVTRQDLFVCVVDAERGVGIVTRGRPENTLPFDASASDALSFAHLRAARETLLNLKAAAWFDGWLSGIGSDVRWRATERGPAPADSVATALPSRAESSGAGLGIQPIRHFPAGTRNERVVFLNSIGGLGDTLPMPIVIQWYKERHPGDTTILYDSLYVHHFCEPFPWVDEVYVASEHLHATYTPGLFLRMDPTLPRDIGVPLRQTCFTRLASTHHAHGRKFAPDDRVIKMDFYSVLPDILRSGFRSFDLRLKPDHMAQVDAIVRDLTADGRMLIGMQTRGACPYGGLMLPRQDYVRDLTDVAGRLVDKYGARVLICGDDRLLAEERYARRDWIALDSLVPNIYYKLEIMKRTRLYLAATSGFSQLVNFMRTPEQIPAVEIYTNPQTLRGASYRMYPDYEKDGGGTDIAALSTFRHPDLSDFLFGAPHTPAKVLAFVGRFLK